MSSKVMLTARLERELVERINHIARQKDISVNDLIDHAVSLVERENREADVILDRVVLLEKNQQALYDLIAVFGENLDAKFGELQARVKEHLKHYFVTLEKQLCDHDAFEVERMKELGDRIRPHTF